MQISCKRPNKTYVPYRLTERLGSRSSGWSAFVGCICGLDTQGKSPSCVPDIQHGGYSRRAQ
jgi:hypothetical protein